MSDNFVILSYDDVAETMIESIKEVNTIIEIPSISILRSLLNYFNWDKEKLLEQFYDSDQNKLFSDAKIINPYVKKLPKEIKPKIMSKKTEECDICITIFEPSNSSELECEHKFCIDCWNEYLKVKIMQCNDVDRIECPANSCDVIVNEDKIMKILKVSELKLKYQKLITKYFIQYNKYLKCCPAPDCQYVVKICYPEVKSVICKCGFNFCFKCLENSHEPINCELLRAWLKKLPTESENILYIENKTKPCPKCQAAIEKISGCNNMYCTVCQCRFCWNCLQLLSNHYGCNTYQKKNTSLIFSLERFKFYKDRYLNHEQSLKLEKSLLESSKELLNQLKENGDQKYYEFKFLLDAVKILCSCRRTLIYTYVFAYYLKINNQSEIFELNQRKFESETENLSEILEKEFQDIYEIKKKIISKYEFLEKLRKTLLEHINEGDENDWWVFEKD